MLSRAALQKSMRLPYNSGAGAVNQAVREFYSLMSRR
jgi:hypothetical protein